MNMTDMRKKYDDIKKKSYNLEKAIFHLKVIQSFYFRKKNKDICSNSMVSTLTKIKGKIKFKICKLNLNKKVVTYSSLNLKKRPQKYCLKTSYG